MAAERVKGEEEEEEQERKTRKEPFFRNAGRLGPGQASRAFFPSLSLLAARAASTAGSGPGLAHPPSGLKREARFGESRWLSWVQVLAGTIECNSFGPMRSFAKASEGT